MNAREEKDKTVDIVTEVVIKEEGQAIRDVAQDLVLAKIRALQGSNESSDAHPLEDKNIAYLYEMLQKTSLEESICILKKALIYLYQQIEKMVAGSEVYGTDFDTYQLDTRLEAVVIHYHSPYPEVRAVTDPTDDPGIPVETFRAYALGIFWVAVSSFINEFFLFRQPSLNLRATVVQMLLFPSGKLCELLPNWGFQLFDRRFSINPGPWTVKEQMLATIMVNVGSYASFWMSVSVALRHQMFFHEQWANFGFVIVMNFGSLVLGFSIAGLLRKLCIFEVKSVFPNILPTLALSRALVMKERITNTNGWTIKRQHFFFLTFFVSFLYFFVPNFLFGALSTFNWMTWIAPQNVKLAIITGSFIGFGLNPVTTFDWSIINYGNPLVYPFSAFMNRFAGTLVGGLIMLGLYFCNYKWTSYMPLNSNSVFDRFGKTYNLSRVLTNGHFDESKYVQYSTPYISAGMLVGTGTTWCLFMVTFTYIIISQYKLIWNTTKSFWKSLLHPNRKALDDYDDPHSRLMSKYAEVPDWWYLIIFVVSWGSIFAALYAWPTTVPAWTVVVIFLFNIAMYVPTLIILSRTGYSTGFSALAVLLSGYMDPGNPVTNIVNRMWGYNVDEAAETFIGDQKVAHYCRIPQRAVFRAQIVATLVQCFCTSGAVEALFHGVKDFCSITQKDRFVCAYPRNVYSDTIMYGIIGPQRLLTTVYPGLKHAFYIGAIIGIPFALLHLKYPKRFRFVNPSLMGSGSAIWGGTYNMSYFIPGLYCSFFFMYYIRRRYVAWWTKYNYILTSGLSAGVAFAGIVLFAALQVPGASVSWWGNNVYRSGVDYARTATLLHPPAGGYGLDIGEFH
ncbi:OPT oligopeptide transporter protein-domain-containing protein [Lipomyces orientalis]|uniref:OPT oligopeptide transporter protein-domain-containing protein n=1 Tax=Lipomyces orientalis TaxID=1233043 RepID=A0ACC3TF09_9ASCO